MPKLTFMTSLGKENSAKRGAATLAPGEEPPAQRRHCAADTSAAEAYMAARIKEAQGLSKIGSHEAARRLLAALTAVPLPMGDAADGNSESTTSTASDAAIFKASALYWCANAAVGTLICLHMHTTTRYSHRDHLTN